jgi:hypothetical protein
MVPRTTIGLQELLHILVLRGPSAQLPFAMFLWPSLFNGSHFVHLFAGFWAISKGSTVGIMPPVLHCVRGAGPTRLPWVRTSQNAALTALLGDSVDAFPRAAELP